MGKLVWKYSFETLYVEGTDMSCVIACEDGVFCVRFGRREEEINLEDVGKVTMIEPKLFSKGSVMFYGKDGEVLKLNNGYSALVEVKKKNADYFYVLWEILRDNDVDVEIF